MARPSVEGYAHEWPVQFRHGIQSFFSPRATIIEAALGWLGRKRGETAGAGGSSPLPTSSLPNQVTAAAPGGEPLLVGCVGFSRWHGAVGLDVATGHGDLDLCAGRQRVQ